jgi:DNA-3-methyladenine glycosylase I
MDPEMSIPDWMYRNSKPDNNGYFENLTRIIFQGGLNWRIIENKWPNFQESFKDFSIDSVSKFSDDDVEKLMNNKGIVRNRAKIIATILNAQKFQTIIKEYGSFQKYLDTLDKSDNYKLVIKHLSTQFSRLGPNTAGIFLFSVGERIEHEM